MNRVQQVLLALLVIQVVIAGAVYMPRNPAAQVGPLLVDFKPDNVVKIDIVDYQNNQAQLAKDGSEWKLVLSEGSMYPTEPDKVKDVLEKLGMAKTNRLVTRTTTSHKQLKVAVDDFVRKVTLTMNDGGQNAIYLGTSPGTGVSHVRLVGKDDVYLASLDSYDYGATANAWINTGFLNVPENSVTTMTMKNANGTYEFTRDASGKWGMKDWGDKPFDTEKFTPLVSRLSTMRMLTPLGIKEDPAYKLENPLAVVTFTYKESDSESPTVTLTIGAKDEENNSFVVKSSTSDYYMKLDGYFVGDYVTSKKDDFIKPEPTATPTSTTPAE